MTINHHPRDETLLRYAAGTLSAGPALVVGVHLEYCDLCGARVADFESIGGQILEDMASRQLVVGALALTLERLDVSSASPRRKAIIAPRRADLGIALPAAMPQRRAVAMARIGLQMAQSRDPWIAPRPMSCF